jgi:hypothetical protein
MITPLCAAAHFLTRAKARGTAVKIAKLPGPDSIRRVSFSGAPSSIDSTEWWR